MDSKAESGVCPTCGRRAKERERATGLDYLELILVAAVCFCGGMTLGRQGTGPARIAPAVSAVPSTAPAARASPQRSPQPSPRAHRWELEQLAQQFVQDHLEPPPTAVHAPDYYVDSLPHGEMQVKGSFTAPNSFGKQNRTEWTVVLMQRADGRWVVKSLDSRR